MRIEQFLGNFLDYNFFNANQLSTSENIRGGWEVWLQVELAMHFINKKSDARIAREECYPDGKSRCDFYIMYADGPGKNETYVELKCRLPSGYGDPTADALNRFETDIKKQQSLPTVPGFCLLASSGSWNGGNIERLGFLIKTYCQSFFMLSAQINKGSPTNGIFGKDELLANPSVFTQPFFFLIGISPTLPIHPVPR